MKLSDLVDFNPKRALKKGCICFICGNGISS